MANAENYGSLSLADKNQEFARLYELIPPHNPRPFSNIVRRKGADWIVDQEALEAIQIEQHRRYEGPFRQAVEAKYRALVTEAHITEYFQSSITQRFLYEWNQGRSQGRPVIMPFTFGNISFNEYNLLDVAVAGSEGIFGNRAFYIEREAYRAALESVKKALTRFEAINLSMREVLVDPINLWKSQMQATHKRSVVD